MSVATLAWHRFEWATTPKAVPSHAKGPYRRVRHDRQKKRCQKRRAPVLSELALQQLRGALHDLARGQEHRRLAVEPQRAVVGLGVDAQLP
eukprot:4402785-Pleurochrysis_carterae.AAC.6